MSCQVAHFVLNCENLSNTSGKTHHGTFFGGPKEMHIPAGMSRYRNLLYFLKISVECLTCKASTMTSCEEIVCLKKRV